MANENWQKAKEIFANAVKVAPEKRVHFLDEVCADDAAIRREVESLLDAHDDAESFMENPAVGEVADVIQQVENLEPGRCFGHYEIIRQIGAGGMGKVYLALDKKLDRQVAVKILNEKFAKQASNLNRFIREAKAASALNHPNILVIHEIGADDDTHFIVSEFIKGETLREKVRTAGGSGRVVGGNQSTQRANDYPPATAGGSDSYALKLSEVLDISIQIANALCTAHEAHLVHRDIKPENIMVRPDGYVKILDFGLAKLVEQKSFGFEDETVKQNETAEGVIIGTVNYMSPEQAKGEQVDATTDIFSFGVVIYEMMAGKTPFAGDSLSETFANLINAEPQPISQFAEGVPNDLSRIVFKMLRKNKTERYQTMSDVLTDLKSLRENLSFDQRLEKSHLPNNENATEILQATTGDTNKQTAETNYSFVRQIKSRKPLAALALIVLLATIGFGFWHFNIFSANTTQIESIAVLPFENQNPDTEYLSDGLTESIINSLSGLAHLRVISRNSVFSYKGKETDQMTVGRDLNVHAVVTGRFVQRGDNLLVSAELTDLRDSKQIWGRQYNRRITDAFALQQEILRDISETLRKQLTGEQQKQLAKPETDSPEAFQFYLKGRYHWNKRTNDGSLKAIDFYNQAIEKDPTFALAYVGLANCYLSVTFKYPIKMQERVALVKATANKALEIDPKLGEIHATLAINYHFNEWDWTNAEREYKLAVELSPNYATAHHWYAEFLATEGRFDESFAEYQRALELDPLSLAISTDLGLNYFYARQDDRAIEHLKKLKEVHPNYKRTHFFLAQVYEEIGMFEEAIAESERAYTISGINLQTLAERKTILEETFKTSGVKGFWQKMLEIPPDGGEKQAPIIKAIFHARLDEQDKAFEFLEKAFDERSPLLVWLKVSPEFDNLRPDPRFADLMRRVGLPQ